MSSTDSYTLHPVDHMPRHMTSSSALTKEHRASQRISQHLRMSPARSPTSIPSSPTSVHSSSSAIFERDIEPLSPPSPQPHPHSHSHPQNPHRIPRSKTTEQLEHSVPSVLDSAAAILAGIGPEDEHQSDQIAVVSPASIVPNSSSFGSGFASPIGSFRSRSPSPTIGSIAGAAANQNRGSLLLNIPSSAPVSPPVVSASPPTDPAAASASAASPVRTRPTITTNAAITASADGSPSAPPSVITPTSAYFTTASGSEPNSPVTTTLEHPSSPLPTPRASSSSPPPHPYLLPSGSTSSPHDISIAPLPLPLPTSPQTPHPHSYSSQQQPLSPHSHSQATPSPPAAQHKRLSFISYSDLLASSPISTLPLSQLTTSASSIEPPPHIPCVSGINAGFHPFLGTAGAGAGSPSPSLRGFVAGGAGGSTTAGGSGGGSVNGVAGIMDEGGEWEREGLGRGLEERLDWVRG